MPPCKKRKKDILYDFEPKHLLHLHRQLFLYGEINSQSSNYIKSNLIAFDIVNKKQPITLWINSPGGSISDGLSIIEIIQAISSPVITIINSEACSMAAMISVVGNARWAFKTGYWMQHPLSSGQIDYLRFLKDRTAYLNELNKKMIQILKDNTELTNSDYKKIESGELWLSGQSLLDKKIVDKLL